MTTAPTISNLEDKGTGTELVLSLSYGVDAATLKVLYRDVANGGVWSEQNEALATSIDIAGLTEGRMYEVLVIALDASSIPSLPSLSWRCIPTSTGDTIARRIEKKVIAALQAITVANGYSYDMDHVYRFGFPINTDERDDDVFAMVAFTACDHAGVAMHGTDIIDAVSMTVAIAAGRKGRDNSTDWIPASARNLLASMQMAMMADRWWDGLAEDTEHGTDTTRPDTLAEIADAVIIDAYKITFRTTEKNPYALVA